MISLPIPPLFDALPNVMDDSLVGILKILGNFLSSHVLIMIQPSILELARQGDANAIVTLMNYQLQTKDITAKVVFKDSCLQVMLESAEIPNQETLVNFIRNKIINLGIKSIERVKVYGRKIGEDFPAWNKDFELVVKTSTTSNPNNLSSLYSHNNETENVSGIPVEKSYKNIDADEYRIAGEKEILFASLGVLGLIFFILLGISLGLVVVIVGLSALWIKVRQGQILGSSIKVSENQLPEIYQAAKVAAERLSMRMPDVFVKHSPEINAYAIGFLDDKKTVVLHSALVEAMNEDELIYIIGHEFSHIKCSHTNWSVLTNTAENVAKIPFLSEMIGFVFLYWSRKCEYTCDRGGLIASRNLKSSITALVKVAVGKELFAKINLDALLDQKRDVDANDVSKLSEIFETHPYIINRIHQLKKFYSSSTYMKFTAE